MKTCPSCLFGLHPQPAVPAITVTPWPKVNMKKVTLHPHTCSVVQPGCDWWVWLYNIPQWPCLLKPFKYRILLNNVFACYRHNVFVCLSTITIMCFFFVFLSTIAMLCLSVYWRHTVMCWCAYCRHNVFVYYKHNVFVSSRHDDIVCATGAIFLVVPFTKIADIYTTFKCVNVH